jgi:putative ABC transport system permease protein
MKIPFTLLNLLHQRLRTLIAIAGVAFSMLLVFMQLGFFGSAAVTATVFFDKLDFDLIVLSRDYMNLTQPGSFPHTRLYQCLASSGVVQASPLWVNGNLWRIINEKDQSKNGLRRGIMVVGFDLGDPVFLLEGLEADLDILRIPGNVLIDTQSRKYFGDRGPGVESDLGAGRGTIVGTFTIGSGYGWDGMLLMSATTFSRIYANMPLNHVNLGFIKLSPGTDPDEAATDLRANLPGDQVKVLTRKAMLDLETDYWLNKTSLGKIFFIGVLVALIVGMVFVYQVLSSDITARFPEYATLKAMGYSDGYLSMQVLLQALVYALLGYFPGLIASLFLYGLASNMASLPISMTWARAGAVLLLALGMCTISALLALQKVKSADPADLF